MTRAEAATALLDATAAMVADGGTLMQRILPVTEPQRLWDRYPPGDIVDPASGARCFYHSHPIADRPDEHGHFHLFLDRSAMPDARGWLIAPPANAVDAPPIVHIVAIAIDRRGVPSGLFTVNRWVTGETLYPAPSIFAALGGFDLARAPGDPLLNRWITAFVQLCRPVIADLLVARDARLRAIGLAGEDRGHEILSAQPIDIDRWIATALV